MIGIPSNFSSSSRECLREAAYLAGFDDVILMVACDGFNNGN